MPSPAQWNLEGWLVSYCVSQDRPTYCPYSLYPRIEATKEDENMDVVTGGWRYEGKEKPAIIRICTRCQGPPFIQGNSNEKSLPEDKRDWCQDCKEGKPVPGQHPASHPGASKASKS